MNNSLKNLKRFLTLLRIYHRYKVEGLDHFPDSGGVLLVTNHSLATYDGFLIGLEILNRKGRLCRGLGDDMLFKVPILQRWCFDIGLVPASIGNAQKLLQDEEVLGVAPGGMREALRPSRERYLLKWHKRKGFIKLAIAQQVPIVLAACPNADRIFKVYESLLTAIVYKKFKFPLPIFKGFGPSYLPRPVKLTHYLSKPIYPPKVEKSLITNEIVDLFHSEVVSEMESLMSKVDY